MILYDTDDVIFYWILLGACVQSYGRKVVKELGSLACMFYIILYYSNIA